MERRVILNRLIDKYENSKHLTQPGLSNRRVMLRIDKKELPEYRYEDASVRDRFNLAARVLEQQKLATVDWVSGRPVIQAIVLTLENVETAYVLAERNHPLQTVRDFCELIRREISTVNTQWISQWGEQLCEQMEQTLKIPSACKQGPEHLSGILRALVCYDCLSNDAITTRAFSSICYSDTKRFEREFQDAFLRISEAYHPELSEICAYQNLGDKEKLALLGIYTRPELYELAGAFSVQTEYGDTDFSAFPSGLAIPSTAVETIRSFDLHKIKSMIFIENKTNYDEYLLSELQPHELVIWHGGFSSPRKRRLIQKLVGCAPESVQFYFWADIDLGGFQMFMRLKQLIPTLMPMRMSAQDVTCFAYAGLKRSDEYLSKLKNALEQSAFPDFSDAIHRILTYGVTIEQEIFLTRGQQPSSCDGEV